MKKETLILEGEEVSKESLRLEITELLNSHSLSTHQTTQLSPDILESMEIHALYSIRNNLLNHKGRELKGEEKDWLLNL